MRDLAWSSYRTQHSPQEFRDLYLIVCGPFNYLRWVRFLPHTGAIQRSCARRVKVAISCVRLRCSAALCAWVKHIQAGTTHNRASCIKKVTKLVIVNWHYRHGSKVAVSLYERLQYSDKLHASFVVTMFLFLIYFFHKFETRFWTWVLGKG